MIMIDGEISDDDDDDDDSIDDNNYLVPSSASPPWKFGQVKMMMMITVLMTKLTMTWFPLLHRPHGSLAK